MFQFLNFFMKITFIFWKCLNVVCWFVVGIRVSIEQFMSCLLEDISITHWFHALYRTEYVTRHVYPNVTLTLFVHLNVKDALNAVFTMIEATDVFPFYHLKNMSPYICAQN